MKLLARCAGWRLQSHWNLGEQTFALTGNCFPPAHVWYLFLLPILHGQFWHNLAGAVVLVTVSIVAYCKMHLLLCRFTGEKILKTGIPFFLKLV